MACNALPACAQAGVVRSPRLPRFDSPVTPTAMLSSPVLTTRALPDSDSARQASSDARLCHAKRITAVVAGAALGGAIGYKGARIPDGGTSSGQRHGAVLGAVVGAGIGAFFWPVHC
jgi:hypothetical protein